MAHEVKINLQSKLVQRQDVEIEVKKDGGKLGTILISKGNIEWVPSGNHVNKHRLTWTQFADLMAEHGAARKIK
jgi:carbon monoxide dehydrogenase subunit G